MIKEIVLNEKTVLYDLQRKNVKNINIRIKSNLSVQVSASSRVTQSQIDNILKEKATFILSAIEKYEISYNL
jgi:predicted metal-dependent hydrolase